VEKVVDAHYQGWELALPFWAGSGPAIQELLMNSLLRYQIIEGRL